MTSPYIDTKLYTNVILHPSQMNNEFYINLKENLINDVEKRCFIDYGYIVKVYDIQEYENGIIEAENVSASSIYNVIFSCRLCRPLKNRDIICEVERINKVLIRLKNGPIFVIITNDRISDKVFFRDNYKNIRYKSDNKSVILNKGDFVKATIIQYTFHSGDESIIAIGYLDNVATEDEVKQFYEDEYGTNEEEIINFEDHNNT
jgi:DNA-directed RNA polymerase subunit E'/Rpb7